MLALGQDLQGGETGGGEGDTGGGGQQGRRAATSGNVVSMGLCIFLGTRNIRVKKQQAGRFRQQPGMRQLCGWGWGGRLPPGAG